MDDNNKNDLSDPTPDNNFKLKKNLQNKPNAGLSGKKTTTAVIITLVLIIILLAVVAIIVSSSGIFSSDKTDSGSNVLNLNDYQQSTREPQITEYLVNEEAHKHIRTENFNKKNAKITSELKTSNGDVVVGSN